MDPNSVRRSRSFIAAEQNQDPSRRGALSKKFRRMSLKLHSSKSKPYLSSIEFSPLQNSLPPERVKDEVLLFGTSWKSEGVVQKETINDQVNFENEVIEQKYISSQKEIPWYVFNYKGKFRHSWNLLIILLLVYTATVTPYSIAFVETEYWDFLTVFDLIVDLVFLADLVFNFFTSYEKAGRQVTDLKRIAKKYLKGWFVVDLVSGMPYTLLGYYLEEETDFKDVSALSRLVKVQRIYKLLRIFKLIKVVKDYSKFSILDHIQEMFHFHTRTYNFIKFVLTVAFFVHLLGCLWVAIAETENYSPQTWVVRYGFADKEKGTLYLGGIYWALTTITTVGYGDISPETNAEMIYAMVAMLVGVGFYSYTIGSFTSFLSDLKSREREVNSKIAAVNAFAKETGLPKEIKAKIRQSIKYNEEKSIINRGSIDSILSELPRDLRYDIALNMYEKAAESMIFFKGTDQAFIVSAMSLLKPLMIHEGKFVYLKDHFADEVYLITKGRVNLVLSEQLYVYRTYVVKSYFGEIEIIFNSRRKDNVVTAVDTEFLTLKKEQFNYLLSEFPVESQKFEKLAQERALKNEQAKQELIQRFNIPFEVSNQEESKVAKEPPENRFTKIKKVHKKVQNLETKLEKLINLMESKS